MSGAKTATTKTATKVVSTSTPENPIETITTEIKQEQSPAQTTDDIIAEETNKEINEETSNEAVEEELATEETSSLPKNKKFQVIMNEEDLKALNNTVSKTGLKRTKLVTQMLEFALTYKDDFFKYHSDKNKEPIISSETKCQEGRPKFCVKTVKKSRKDNFLLIANADLINKADILAKELEISRNKFINEAILFALESM